MRGAQTRTLSSCTPLRESAAVTCASVRGSVNCCLELIWLEENDATDCTSGPAWSLLLLGAQGGVRDDGICWGNNGCTHQRQASSSLRKSMACTRRWLALSDHEMRLGLSEADDPDGEDAVLADPSSSVGELCTHLK